MEKSANTIGKHKFLKLSSRRQHELLSSLARKALSTGDVKSFYNRYKKLQSWADLDCYTPPEWLSEKEALAEYMTFHSRFSSASEQPASIDISVSWQPEFEVEVAVDQIRSPYNVGSILRILDNFSFKGMIHCSE